MPPQRHHRRVVLGLVLLAAAIWAYTGVTGSYYLGTYQGNVAVWRGSPRQSHSDSSSSTGWKAKPVSSCPTCPKTRKTASRRAFRQTSVDDAQDTISKYRHQIDEEQTRQVIDAQTIRDNTDQGSTSESYPEKTAE